MTNFFKLSMIALMACNVLITSCKDDEDGGQKNEVKVGDDSYNIKSSNIMDYGPEDVAGTSDSHYNYDFYFSDGNLTYGLATGASFLVYAETFAAGAEGFTTGTFKFMDYEDVKEGDYFFDYASITLDTNGDGIIDPESEESHYVTDGTITISGTSPNFTVKFDVTLENGKTLTSSYSGEFPILQAD